MKAKQKNLFSLIELLVVVAIILILMSLIQPALRRAIDLSITTKCLVQMRAWTSWTLMFADDHNGEFMEEGFNHDWSKSWMRELKEYHGDAEDRQPFYCPAAEESSSNGHGNTFEAWDGPKIGHFTPNRGGGNDRGSYGFNLWMMKVSDPRFSWRNSVAEAELFQFHRLRNVDNPSRTPAFADSAWYGFEPHPNVNTLQGMPAPDRDYYKNNHDWRRVMARLTMDRHQKAINLSFIDGSARNVYLGYLWDFQWTKDGWEFREEVPIPWLD